MLKNRHPGKRRGPWIGNTKNANLALLLALNFGFVGLMDPGMRRDDVRHEFHPVNFGRRSN